MSNKMTTLWGISCGLLMICARIVHGQNGNDDLDSTELDDGKLIFAQTICRHGDRNIYRPYPNDPWGSEEFWPGGYSALTNEGKREHYELGGYLRKRYASLLGNGEYSPDTVYIRSTDTDRTLMSAEANLAALFVPFGDQIWNDELLWQPVPIHVQPANQDYVLATQKKCNRFDYEMLKFINGSVYKGIFTQYKPLIDHLRINTNSKLTTILQILLIYDTLYVEKLKGKCLPRWAEKVMIPGGGLENIAKFFYGMHTSTDFMKKIKAGFLIKDIFDHISSKIASKLTPSLYLYFAHDITITNVLNSLGLYEMQLAPYASCLIFELYKTEEQSYVKLFYKNFTEINDNVIPPLLFPGCEERCSIEKLHELYGNILPTQSFEEECRLHEGETLPPGGNPESYALE